MIVDLVHILTRDGLRLHGAYQPPVSSASPELDLDAVCFFHGTGGNFYSSSLFDVLGDRLRSLGCGVLRVNSRGHDLMSVAAQKKGGGIVQGAAYEVVERCRHDVAAWMDWLRQAAGERIGLIGHSLGAVKALFAVAQEPPLNPRCLVAISPPRLSYSWFAQSEKSQEFLALYQEAQALVDAGEGGQLMPVSFPLPMVITAEGYVDKYGPEERYNYFSFVDGCQNPTMITLGELEVADHVAFQNAPKELKSLEQKYPQLSVKTIANADHFYTEARQELSDCLECWLKEQVSASNSNGWQI